jgi:C4-type Zn-finger protein
MANSVPCPCCAKELYVTEHIEGPYSGKVSGPSLQQDSSGAFMICPHCTSRIEFVGSGQLQPSPIQPCKKQIG